MLSVKHERKKKKKLIPFFLGQDWKVAPVWNEWENAVKTVI